MGVTIPKDATLLGIPLLKVRNLLENWHRNGPRHAWSYVRRRGIELEPSTAAVLVEELRSRGLIGMGKDWTGRDVSDVLTREGMALGSAKVVRRTGKTAAKPILDGLLDAADHINARPDLPFRVGRIWLFGSMIDPDKADVGDIDFCAEFEDTPGFEDTETWIKRHHELARELNLPASDFVRDPVRDRMLFGPRRHPLLAQNSVDRMIRLGCPCRLAFDAERGGRVDDLPLGRHPRSSGRDPNMPEPAKMPDLSPRTASAEPVHVDLLIPAELPTLHDFAAGFPDYDDETISELWYSHSGRLPIVLSKTPMGRARAEMGIPPSLQLSSCDGRSKFALLTERPERRGDGHGRRPPGCGFVVSRSISREDGVEVYRLGIDQYAGEGGRVTNGMMEMAHWVLQGCMRADVERIVRRSAEAGSHCVLRIDVDNTCSEVVPKNLVEYLVDDIPSVLSDVLLRTGKDCTLLDPKMPAGSAAAWSPGS